MRALAVFLALTVGAGVARADIDYTKNANDGSAIKVRRQKSRTMNQKLLVGGLLLGAAGGIGLGAYFHVDSRNAADEVSANGDPTGETWTPGMQATYDRAEDSGTYAAVGYVAGALFLTGALVAMWKTQPGYEEIEVEPTPKTARAVIAPVKGGAIVGGAWSW